MVGRTIGFISTWPIYQGITIDRYAHSLIYGIRHAAKEFHCDLLLGCGISPSGKKQNINLFWPVPSANVDFVPIGPWNTDGLIIVPDELTKKQTDYIEDLENSGFPIIFTTPEGPGSVVTVDNALGIHLAFEHLLEHGHKDIAFIAGNEGDNGDSGERLNAYRNELSNAGLPINNDLIAYGNHNKKDGKLAMQRIINYHSPFSAVIASNDLSCLGAINTLHDVGFRIPEDVAVIGFDDIIDARTLSPSLTTVRHPTFNLGYQALKTLLDIIEGKQDTPVRKIIPPRLIVRESCGCQPMQFITTKDIGDDSIEDVARSMTEAAMVESQNIRFEELEEISKAFLSKFNKCLQLGKPEIILSETKRILSWITECKENPVIWKAAISVLISKIDILTDLLPKSDTESILKLLTLISIEVCDYIQRDIWQSLLYEMNITSELGKLTAKMLATISIDETTEILTRSLPNIGINDALVALYNSDSEDGVSQSKILFGTGRFSQYKDRRFLTRQFPIQDFITQNRLFEFVILPFRVENETKGFIAFDAPNMEFCAAIVHNLSSVLRTNQLYLDAVDGRKLAEEENRLKSRFLSTVSHELRTPLSLIVGLTEMAMNNHTLDERDLEQIHNNAQHLAHLIEDVLDLESSEVGQLHILRENVDLTRELLMPAKIGQQLAHEKGLKWEFFITPEALNVVGDKTRLSQITLNLLSNAVKFTDIGRIVMKVYRSDNQAIISISDTGMGVDPSYIESIFDEYFRSEKSIRNGKGGMGLGLAITKQLVLQHNGKIDVKSPGELGCGSTFTVSLPLVSSFKTIANPLKISDVNNEILLLVEGGNGSKGLESLLETKGYHVKVVPVRDGSDDWTSMINSCSPDAIIISKQLVAHNGWEVARMIQKKNDCEDVPIFTYTLDKDLDRGELLELNTATKPVDINQVKKIISRNSELGEKSGIIVVVDDDVEILNMHCRMLNDSGYQAIAARSGQEALNLIENIKPDLILLDLMMPGMDGFEVMERLQAQCGIRDIPVIILSARELTNDEIKHCSQSVANILTKGIFNTKEILQKIDSAINGQNSLGTATQQYIRKAMFFIQSNYQKTITRDDIANYVGISADYLTDCFRQEFGITPIPYIRRFRICKACDLMRNTNKSITQIALEVGFSGSSHFSHVFSNEMGMTPRAFRYQEEKKMTDL